MREVADRTSADIAGFTRTWTLVGGLRIHAAVASDAATRHARPVVLVHGSGLSGRYMLPTAERLAPVHPVYVPDLPGFGDSDKPARALGLVELAHWLAAWLAAVPLDAAVLLGNSFGCQVIAELAARHPEPVDRVVLQGPTTPPEERSWLWQFVRWRQNQRYNPRSLGPITHADYRKCGLRRMYRTFHDQLTGRLEQTIARVRAPVLIVRGSEDPIATQRWCALLARRAPRGQLVVIPGVAHTLCYTAPGELARVTRAFLAEGAWRSVWPEG